MMFVVSVIGLVVDVIVLDWLLCEMGLDLLMLVELCNLLVCVGGVFLFVILLFDCFLVDVLIDYLMMMWMLVLIVIFMIVECFGEDDLLVDFDEVVLC